MSGLDSARATSTVDQVVPCEQAGVEHSLQEDKKCYFPNEKDGPAESCHPNFSILTFPTMNRFAREQQEERVCKRHLKNHGAGSQENILRSRDYTHHARPAPTSHVSTLLAGGILLSLGVEEMVGV